MVLGINRYHGDKQTLREMSPVCRTRFVIGLTIIGLNFLTGNVHWNMMHNFRKCNITYFVKIPYLVIRGLHKLIVNGWRFVNFMIIFSVEILFSLLITCFDYIKIMFSSWLPYWMCFFCSPVKISFSTWVLLSLCHR